MKALTVWQPWASLIAIGAKPYEFRSWEPPAWIVGQRIAIHAGKRPVRKTEVRALICNLDGRAFARERPALAKEIALPFLCRVLEGLADECCFGADKIALPYSQIVCTAIVGVGKPGDVCAREFGIDVGNDSDREGQFNWGWPMIDIRTVMPPIPIRGAQGLWNAGEVD